VYALACVLYESLTGEAPFPSGSLEQIMTAHLFTPPPQPSLANRRLSPAFDDVIARGMAKEPDDRYGSCGALGRATQRALQSDTIVESGPRPTVRLPPHRPAGYPGTAPPTVVRPTDIYNPAPSYNAGPPPPPPTPPPAARTWLVPTIIVVAVLVLGGIGITIGMLSNDDKPTPTEPDTPDAGRPGTDTDTTGPGPTSDAPTPTADPLSVGSPPPPPLIGNDTSANPKSCTGDYALNGRNEVGTHARRGSAATSCLFTESVLHSYWREYGDATRDLRKVSAPGAVDCSSIAGIPCDGPNFVMECQARPGNAYITCTGGRDAVVYLY